MRLSEKMQFKLRNFLYEQDRKKNTKFKDYEKSNNHSKESKTAPLMQAIDEMDEYLEEVLKAVPLPKKKQ